MDPVEIEVPPYWLEYHFKDPPEHPAADNTTEPGPHLLPLLIVGFDMGVGELISWLVLHPPVALKETVTVRCGVVYPTPINVKLV